jgi:hypothetical protein
MNYPRRITREKHLDHLTRVVPLLALAYGIQSYLMMKWSQGGPTGFLVVLLGISLALSVLVLVTYDQRHTVTFGEEGFCVRYSWMFKPRNISKDEIKQIVVVGEPDQFQSVVVSLKTGRKVTFHFADNGEEFKTVLLTPAAREKFAA